MRHVYGQTWIDLIKGGNQHAETLPTFNPTTNNWDAFRAIPWLSGNTAPLWLVEGYLKIWNRFFRPPRQGNSERDNTYTITDNDERFGFLCAALPAIWNIGHTTANLPTNDTVTAGASFTLTDLAKQAGEFETALQREWTSHYYHDIMKRFGGYARTDADERPAVLAHSSKFMSGFDVYGTAGSSMGEAVGRSETAVGHRIPRKLMAEHGHIWTVAVARYPNMHANEAHYLAKYTGSDYATITGDPNESEKREPHELKVSEVFRNTSATTSLGSIPFNQWWRTQPNIIDQQYELKEGLPFYKDLPTSLSGAALMKSDEYGDHFKNEEFQHWQYAAKNTTKVLRAVGKHGRSLFAGTELK